MFSVCSTDFKITLHWARQKACFIQCSTEIETGVACNIVIDWYNLRRLSVSSAPHFNLVFNTDAYISSRPKEQRKNLNAGEAWYLAISCLRA